MRLKNHPDCHLTYCTNIHPGENWTEVFEQLKKYLPELKRRISPQEPFGVGLRLSEKAASQLLDLNMEEFRMWLQSEGFYVFTLNGFPYGNFHGNRVKDDVYQPDWQSKERVLYTRNLITILSDLLPAGIDGSISTSPLSYKYWPEIKENEKQVIDICIKHLVQIAFEMAVIEKKTGKVLHLDIEPEPDCILENTYETISFFSDHLFMSGAEYLGKKFGISTKDSKKILQKHIRICYDTCHFAVEFEDSVEFIKNILDAGIKIGKTQVSAALKVKTKTGISDQQQIILRLASFDEPTYLHQVVVEDTKGAIRQYRDLPQALQSVSSSNTKKEWRIHFHVPLYTGQFNELFSTRDTIPANVNYLLKHSDCRHFEIETYTWEVLPANERTNLLDSIEREFKWVMDIIKS